MKKNYIIFFLIAVGASISAQNNHETLKWLKKQKARIENVSSNRGVSEGKIEFTDIYLRVYSNKNGEMDQTIIYWSQIRSITQSLNNSGRYHITISMEEEKYTNIFFFYSGNGFDIVDKLAYMSKLNGADVIIKRFDLRGF